MKNTYLLLSIILFLVSQALPAQLRFSVAGDGQVSGELKVGGSLLLGDQLNGEGTKLLWLPAKKALRWGELEENPNSPALEGNYWAIDSVGDNSFAGGRNSIATSFASFVGAGSSNAVRGARSFIGAGNTHIIDANGSNAFIGSGSSNTIEGSNSFIGAGGSNRMIGANASGSFIGAGSLNDITQTFAFIGAGDRNVVNGDFSFIGAGRSNTASHSSAFVGAGRDNVAGNFYSFVGAGAFNVASGSNSFIGSGSNNTASGAYSSILGLQLDAPSYTEFVVGAYNEIYTPNSTFLSHPLDRLFVIGNGLGDDMRSNAMTVLKNGKVGIGVSSPEDLLTVEGGGATTRIRLRTNTNNNAVFRAQTPNADYGWYAHGTTNTFHLYDYGVGRDLITVNSNGNTGVHINTPDGNNSGLSLVEGAGFGYEFQYDGSTDLLHLWSRQFSGNEGIRMTWEKNGDVGIGTTTPAGRLDVAGNIYQNGSLIHSDARFKQNILPIGRALQKLRQLRGVSYNFRTKTFEKRGFSQGRHLGIIAQEVETVFPELVFDRPDGYKAVQYDGLIPVLIEGIKEQQEIIDGLEQDLLDVKQEIAALKKLLAGHSTEPGTDNRELLSLSKPAELEQNYPNPFRRRTAVRYFVPQGVQNAYIQVIDSEGKELGRTEIRERGAGQLFLEVTTYPAGTYYYSLILDGAVWETRSMVFAK